MHGFYQIITVTLNRVKNLKRLHREFAVSGVLRKEGMTKLIEFKVTKLDIEHQNLKTTM